jgi:hypothetical protein
MKKALMLVAYPKIPGTVPRYGMQLSAGRDQGQYRGAMLLVPVVDLGMVRRYRDKPAILKIGSATLREGPNAPVIVLKERLDTVVRQSSIGDVAHVGFSLLLGAAPSASLTVNGDLPVVPSVQTVRSAEPNTAVPGT